MPISGEQDRPTAEAIRWLLAAEDNPQDPELRARLDAWLAQSPANAAAWANASRIYRLMDAVPPAYAAQWAHAPQSAPIKPRAVRGARRLVVGILAAATIAGLVLAFAPAILLRLGADYATSTGEVRALRLEDGSMVQLGADSAVDVAFAAEERRVRLLQGSAFFEVAHDAQQPFRVLAGAVETVAIGTAFEVRMHGESVAVTVQQGRVGVSYQAATHAVSEQLKAGDSVRVELNGDVARTEVALQDVAPWRQGQIVANDRPLAEVVDELRAYYHGMIVFAGAGLDGKRVTGVYNVSDPLGALQAMAGAHGAMVHRISPWLLVVEGS